MCKWILRLMAVVLVVAAIHQANEGRDLLALINIVMALVAVDIAAR